MNSLLLNIEIVSNFSLSWIVVTLYYAYVFKYISDNYLRLSTSRIVKLKGMCDF